MTSERLWFIDFTVSYFILLSSIQFQTTISANDCAPSACGDIFNISYPFRLETDPVHYGDYGYNLSCENNSTVLYLNGGKYHVKAINYNNFTIRLVDAGVRLADCSSIPRFPLEQDLYLYGQNAYSSYSYIFDESNALSEIIVFIKCPNRVHSPLYVDTSPCTNNDSDYYSYVNIGGMSASALISSCRIEMVALLPLKDYKKNLSFIEIHADLAYGFEMSWSQTYCRNCQGPCYQDSATHIQCWDYGYYDHSWLPSLPEIGGILLRVLVFLVKFLAGRCACGTPFVAAFLIYKWRRRHLSEYHTIEDFLRNQNNLLPIRYSYWDIWKMTGGLKEKLGQGGFGSVYKGKLRSGQLAAIKMLSASKADGQGFINEVTTIGRIHHANVVSLIGFCVQGSKQALIYEFMANGSLDKYIFQCEGSVSLSWEKLHEISLGVARGIEYLHRGCDMQILHFDVKPHNILLDENFTPKISDFGLAKLYPTKGSVATLTAARGTIGYMAPELFYKNIGRVSYKADVYSFGMLLLEMTDRRKNLNNKVAENLSEVYYPFWVHDQLSNGKLTIEDELEEGNEIAKKMILTGLWCVQMQPLNRPPMHRVIEMLEGDLESLQLPPRPLLFPIENCEKSSTKSFDFAESSSAEHQVG